MITILKGKEITVEWKVVSLDTKQPVDFEGVNAKVFLLAPDNIYTLPFDVVRDDFRGLRMTIPTGYISTGVYDLKVIWLKDAMKDKPVYRNVSVKREVFALTDEVSEVTYEGDTIKIATGVESCGRDGLSAYEIAVFRGFAEGMSEKEWVESLDNVLASEASRVKAEDERVKAEDERVKGEDLRIRIFTNGEEDRRQSFEISQSSRTDAFNYSEAQRQSIFESKEAQRDNNENSRMVKEEQRKIAETSRKSNEQDREKAESGRVSAESTRVADENIRKANEQDRVDAEKNRVNAETSRANAEVARVNTENTRKSNEQVRVSAENGRVSAEAAREAAEGVREATFQANEAIREANETSRQDAEVIREENERRREEAAGLLNAKADKTAVEAAINELTNAIPEVVNDLTTGGADKALSAEMGKKLSATSAGYASRRIITEAREYGFIKIGDGTINNTQTPNEWKNTGHVLFNRNDGIRFAGDTKNEYIHCVAFYDYKKRFIFGKSITDVPLGTVTEITSDDIPIDSVYFIVCQRSAYDIYVEYTDGSNIINAEKVNALAEGIELGNKVSSTKQDIIIAGKNLISEFIEGEWVNSKGEFTSVGYGIGRTNYIAVKEGVSLTVSGSTQLNQCRAALYDANFKPIFVSEAQSVGVYNYTLKYVDGAKYAVFTLRSSPTSGEYMVEYGDYPTEYQPPMSIIEYVDNLYKDTTELAGDSFIDGMFMNHEGTVYAQSGYATTDYIDIADETSIKVNGLFGNPYGGGVSFYNESKEFILNISESENGIGLNVRELEIPTGAKYCRVCTKSSDKELSYIILNRPSGKVVDYINKQNKATKLLPYLFSRVDNLIEGASISTEDTPNSKNYHTMSFSANFTTMGKLRMSHGLTAYVSGIVEIDDTNIYVYANYDPSRIIQTIPHGLSMNSFIRCSVIVQNTPNKAVVHLSTLGSEVTKEIHWNGCRNGIELTSMQGAYSNVCLTYGGSAFDKKVWIFGDSYTDYWPSHIYNAGCKNFYLDGHSGRKSKSAVTSLIYSLSLGIPKAIVWMLGMNDLDEENSVNIEYKNSFDEAKMICDNMGVEFIPVTIPNTPSRINYWKNEYIRANSSYYIDMAKALGADFIGAEWHNGLISNDSVHPSEAGAKVIANVLMENLPSIYG